MPWSDVLPDLYRCSRMAICVFTVFTLVSVNLAVCIIIRSDYIMFSISPLRHFDELLSALHKFHPFFESLKIFDFRFQSSHFRKLY